MVPIGFVFGYLILGLIAWAIILSKTGNAEGLHTLVNGSIDLLFWPVTLLFTILLNLLNPDSDFLKAVRRDK